MTAQRRPTAPETNWDGTYRYRAAVIHRPDSTEQVQSLVARSTRLRALGTRHSFTDIADSDELVSLAGLRGEPDIDSAARTVTVPAGLRYGALASFLESRGWALHNLASLPHISVGRSLARATHGSGSRNRIPGDAVQSMTVVVGSGEAVTIARTDTDFEGCLVHLGALGVVTELTLSIEPSFQVRQSVYERLPWESVIGDLAGVMDSGYSVSVMTDFAGDAADQVWVKARFDPADSALEPTEFFGAVAAPGALHPTPGGDPAACTPQRGVPGAWCDRLPHFKLDFMPSTGDEMQSEYILDRAHAVDAIGTLRALGDLIAPVVKRAEIRTIASDGYWLSPSYLRESVAFHFTWRPHPQAVAAVIAEIEVALVEFEPRPHWGKVFASSARPWSDLYPRMKDFRQLAESFDPCGAFRNAFLDRTVFAD